MQKKREIIKTRKLASGRFEATLVIFVSDGNCSRILSKKVRTDTSEELAITGVKNAAMIEENLDRLW